eukprot:Hpha_TRINITY_DN34780_c0_g1::TRINITY_DN34780_c0_g1_i1::g.177985::m.177985
MGPILTVVYLLVLLCCLSPASAGGGAKLWELGDEVEQNPITVFSMFCFTVFLTILVELLKHKVEARTHDPSRKKALGAIYAELMMVGVVSFLLIVSAELGLTDIRIYWFCGDGSVAGSSVAAGGSGSAAAGSATAGSAAAGSAAAGSAVAAGSATGVTTGSAAGPPDVTTGSAAAGSATGVITGSGVAGGTEAPIGGGSAAVAAGSGDTGSPVVAAGSAAAATSAPIASGSGAAAVTLAPVAAAAGSGAGVPERHASELAVYHYRYAAELAASGSASSSQDCSFGFDLLLFEYAHLVLFFMGLTYCAFIQWSFYMRDRYCKTILADQCENTLYGWFQHTTKKVPVSVFGPIGFSHKGWARTILTMRGILVLHHKEQLRQVCTEVEDLYDEVLADLRGEPLPATLGHPKDAEIPHRFCMARFTSLAMSESMVDMLHIPAIVWISILLIALGNLIHKLGLALVDAVAITAILGPGLSSVLLWRMSVQLHIVASRGVGHPQCPRVEFEGASGNKIFDQEEWKPDGAEQGRKWAEAMESGDVDKEVERGHLYATQRSK